MKIKERFSALDEEIKIFLAVFYMSGLAFFIVGIGLGWGFFEVGLSLAIINSFITDSLIANIKIGNKAPDVSEIARFRFAKNALASILICYFIAWFHQVILAQIFHFYLEPITFGIIYATLHMSVFSIGRKIVNFLKKITRLGIVN